MLWDFLRGVDRGWVEPVVVFFEGGQFERDVAGLGLETAVIETGRLRQLAKGTRAIRALADLLRRRQPDILVNWSPKTQLYGATAAARAGLRDRVVWWQHSFPERAHWIDRAATALPTLAVGCSSAATSEAQQRLRPRRRTFVVHPGVVVPAARSGDGAALELGIPRSRVVLGMLGRLQPWKGQDRFIRALSSLRSRGLDVHGLIVGGDAYHLSPQYAASLEPLAKELGVADYVTLTGHVADSWPYLQAMDILVSASQKEPFGISILEAMAAGVPVVAVGGAGPSEIIEPGRTGVLVDSDTPESLATGAASLIHDADRRKRFSAEARERARTHFSVGRMVDELTEKLVALAREVR
jgi:glycosyltransferase involved in cell wall biosynthesis